MSQGPGVILEQPFLEGEPIRAISYLEPDADWDSGYCVWTSRPEDAAQADTTLIHIGCLLDEWAPLAFALQHAREHGEWIAETLSGAALHQKTRTP